MTLEKYSMKFNFCFFLWDQNEPERRREGKQNGDGFFKATNEPSTGWWRNNLFGFALSVAWSAFQSCKYAKYSISTPPQPLVSLKAAILHKSLVGRFCNTMLLLSPSLWNQLIRWKNTGLPAVKKKWAIRPTLPYVNHMVPEAGVRNNTTQPCNTVINLIDNYVHFVTNAVLITL